jgi:hypothetical protein
MLVVMKVLPLGVIDRRREDFRVGGTFGKLCVFNVIERKELASLGPRGDFLFGIRNKTDGVVGLG